MEMSPELREKILEVFPRPCVDIVLKKGDTVFLARRAIEPNKGTWAIPGGEVNKGERQINACQRKALQETGLEIPPDSFQFAIVVDWFLPERHDICNTYTVEVEDDQEIKLDFQHSEYRWVPAGALAKLDPPLQENIWKQIMASMEVK
jgi:8-oxo-dGTP diphosphatase